MSFDTKCYDLAQSFLSDEEGLDTEQNRTQLAQNIQDEIEGFIEIQRIARNSR